MGKEQMLRDPDAALTSEAIMHALGNEAYKAYIEFVEELESHSINIEWRYYTDGKAWLGKGVYKWLGPRGGQKSLTAFWMSIWDGFFQVTVYIQEKHRDGALNLALGDSAMQMLKQAATMGKHFPLTFEIASNSPFGDLFTLIEYKKSLG